MKRIIPALLVFSLLMPVMATAARADLHTLTTHEKDRKPKPRKPGPHDEGDGDS